MLHCKVADKFGCSTTFDSTCICDDILLEHLIFTIHTSGIHSKFSNFISTLEKSSDFVKDDLCGPITQSHPVFSALQSFFDLCVQLNSIIVESLCTICEVFSPNEFQTTSPKLQTKIRSVISSTLLPPHVQTHIDSLLCAYLSLELEAAELECDQYNVFSSVIHVEKSEAKYRLIHLCRQLNQPGQLLTLSLCCRQLFLFFAKVALNHRIKLLCAQGYSEHILDALLKYKNEVMIKSWLVHVFSSDSKHDQWTLANQLPDELIYQLYYEVRKPDLFSLIIEFPDSMAALQDLGKCLDHISFRLDLIANLTECIERRLLHPGVHTEQILVAYGYLVRALRLIDKSSLVQDVVCRPVLACLRQREDAIHCIMDKLLYTPEQEMDGEIHAKAEDSAPTTELYSELLLRKPLEVASIDGAEDSDAEFVSEDPAFDEDMSDGGKTGGHGGSSDGWNGIWQPDPVEAVYQGGLWRRHLDLLSMLVSIYGSKKAFLVEYKQLLSQRLLRQRSFHTARELRNLELLKLRFGEQNLVECEVMLKDIRDSKRVAALVSEAVQRTPTRSSNALVPTKSDSSSQARGRTVETSTNENTEHPAVLFPLSAYILSAHYWPELLDDRFKLPDGLRSTFDVYERTFQRFKGNRTLQWMHKLGLVNIELELGDRKTQLDVSPLQACIGYLFTTRRTWSLRDLAQELETQLSTVRQSLHVFIQSGFIRQCVMPESSSSIHAEVFEVCDAGSSSNTRGLSQDVDPSVNRTDRINQSPSNQQFFSGHGSELDGVVSTVRERKEKELQIFWSYIVAMLTNLGGLSLDRIHSMLRMFAMGSTSGLDCTRDELKQFLDKKLHHSELAFDGETYMLAKPDG